MTRMADLKRQRLPAMKMTPGLNRFISFLESSISESEVCDSELDDIRAIIEPREDEKYLYHLALYVYLNDEELRSAIQRPENEHVFSFLPILEDENVGGLSSQMYCDLVCRLGLIEDCICLISSQSRNSFLMESAKGIVDRIIGNVVADTVSFDTYDIILSTFVKLANRLEGNEAQFYSNLTENLLSHFMNLTRISQHLKLVLIFRLVGLASLQHDDVLDNEVSVLLSEWRFDTHDQVLKKMKSAVIFETLSDTHGTCSSHPNRIEILLHLLDSVISKISVQPEEQLDVLETAPVANLPWMNYIGACAYLANLIMGKRTTIDTASFQNLKQSLHKWTDYKPKMKTEDFHKEEEDLLDFQSFCERMKTFGQQDLYRKDWIEKFLAYSEEDIVRTPEGREIAGKFLLCGADYDGIKAYVYKSSLVGKLDEATKQLVLAMMIQNTSVVSRIEEFIQEISSSVMGGKFRTAQFEANLNSLCTQLGNIESESDSEKLAKHQLLVVSTCLQDPREAVLQIMERSVRTRTFRGLEMARPFYNLRCSLPDNCNLIPVLIPQCFNHLLKKDIYPDAILDHINQSLTFLILKNVITFGQIFVVLKYRIAKMLTRTGNVDLAKVIEFVQVLQCLVGQLEEDTEQAVLLRKVCCNDVLTEICNFTIMLRRFFYSNTSLSTLVNAMKIRESLASVLKSLNACGVVIKESNHLSENDLEDVGLPELGILYTRVESLRSIIQRLVVEAQLCRNLDLEKLLQYTLDWVLNSCSNEWDPLIEFVFEIVFKSESRVSKISKVQWLNDFLLAAYYTSTRVNAPCVFLHALKFHAHGIQTVQQLEGLREFYVSDIVCTLGRLYQIMSVQNEAVKKSSKHESAAEFRIGEIGAILLRHLLKVVEDSDKKGWKLGEQTCNSLVKQLDIPMRDKVGESIRVIILKSLPVFEKSPLA